MGKTMKEDQESKIKFEKVTSIPWSYRGTSKEISPVVKKMEEEMGKMRVGQIYKVDVKKQNPTLKEGDKLDFELHLCKSRLHNTGRRISRAKGWKYRIHIRKYSIFVERMPNNWTRFVSKYERK